MAGILALGLAIALRSGGSAAAPRIVPRQMLLRLHDLPPGYLVGDDSGCGQMGTEGAPPELAVFVVENHPRGCSFQYERLYRLPGHRPYPALVESMAFAVPTAETAGEGLELAPQLIASEAGINRLDEVAAPQRIGDATRRFHTSGALVGGQRGRQGSIVTWRFGRALALLVVAGQPRGADDRIALRLAHRQQTHLERPTPYPRRQYDDTLVPLDNPALRMPVFWLGRAFRPGHGLRPVRLERAYGPIERGGGPPWEKLELWYAGSLYLRAWKPTGWELFRKTRFGRLALGLPCARSTEFKFKRGQATILASHGMAGPAEPPPPVKARRRARGQAIAGRGAPYAARPQSCPDKPPNRFTAVVHIDHVVVAVNLPPSIPAASEPGYGPYNSVRGMKAVVRSLRLRPRRR
jgi:hypothetical protein